MALPSSSTTTPPSSAPARTTVPGHAGTNQDLYVDIAVPPIVNAGSVFRSLVTVINLSDQPVRVRVRLELPEGWILNPQADLESEKLIDSFDEIGAEVEIEVPRDAVVGTGEKIRIIGEITGEPGYADAVAVARITGRGGLKAGQMGVTGSAQVASRSVDTGSLDWRAMSANLNLSGPVSRGTTASLSYQKGLRLDQPPILTTLSAELSRLDFTLRARKWNLYTGNYLLSPGGTIAGPFVRGRGATFRFTGTKVQTELSVAQPSSFSGDFRGELVRAQAQHVGATGPIGVSVSDLRGAATGLSARTYDVSGAGAFGRFDKGILRLGLKAGAIRLATDTLESEGRTIETDFGLAGRRGNITGRWRAMPAAVAGTYLPPNETSGDAALTVSKIFRLNARAYRSSMATIGDATPYTSEGTSAGVTIIGSAVRMSLRGNLRSSTYRTSTEQRSVQLTAGTSLGDVSITTAAELGRQTTGSVASPLSNLYLATRWVGSGSSIYSAISYYDYGTSPARLRFDASASLRLKWLELDGGFWATHGPKYGGDPVLWTNVVVPAPAGFSIILGGEYVYGREPYIRYVDPVTGQPLSPEIADDPTRAPFVGVPVEVPNAATRFTLGLRRRLTVPLSFFGQPARNEP